MDLTPEQIEELFLLEEPDVRICLHELRIKPILTNTGDHGYIARMVGHGADGKPTTIDFLTVESTLQELSSRCIEAGMQAAFAAAVESGDGDRLLSILTAMVDGDERS